MIYLKKITLLFLIMFGFTMVFQAQQIEPIDLTNLSVPNSPAFMLLDVAPTQIERPTSGKAFALSVLNSVNENNGIPQNYAVEFTPYWYFKHKNLTAFKYWGIDPKENKNKGFSQLKLANISFAYVNTKSEDTICLKNLSNIAIGLRGNIFKLISKKNRNDLIDANREIISRLKALNDLIATLDIFAEDYKAQVQAILDNMGSDAELVASQNNMQEILNRKPFFAVDGATAVNWAFDGNNYNTNQLSLFGAWLTFDYSLELNPGNNEQKNYLSVLMLTRYTYDNSLDGNPLTNGEFLNLFDLGGKIAFEFKQLTFSGEYIFRSVSNQQNNTFRATGMAMYKVSEKVYLLAALGKNFGDTNNLIAQFGINLGFGTGNEKVWTIEK